MTSKTAGHQEPKEIKHVRDIFKENGNSFKRIGVIGNTSIGKTTLCRSILRGFCCCCAAEKDSHAYDIDLFDWCFFISLAKFNTTSNVLDMIKNRYFQNQGHMLKQILDKSERVLIILDDFDKREVQQKHNEGNTATLDNLNIDGLQLCTILITTRPSALIEFKSSGGILECDSKITMKEITGTAATYLQRAVKVQLKVDSHMETDKPRINDFRITKNPLILKQLVRLYCSSDIQKDPEEPLCKTIGKIVLNWLKDETFIDETEKHCMKQLPECLKTEEKDHTFLLSMLGKVAFDVLFEQGSTYFKLKSLRDVGLSESMIQTCQNIGLLTEGLDNCLKPDDVPLVSFPHILYLDYFAAVHLFMNPEDVAKLLEKCNTAEQMMSFRYIFIFLSGMNAPAMSSAFKKMRDILNNETSADKESKLGAISFINIQYLVVECIGDQQQSSDTLLEIYISSDVFNGNISVNDNTFLKSLQKCDALKSVTLEMYDRMDTIKEGLLLQTIKTKHNTLTTLAIIGSGCTHYLECFYSGKVLRLRHLEISHIEISHADKHRLMRGVAKIVTVQVLLLVDIKCKDHEQCPCPLDLVSSTQLEKLTLTQIQLGCIRVSTASLTEDIQAETAVFYYPDDKRFNSSSKLTLENLSILDVKSFADLLPRLSGLSHLEIKNSDFGDQGFLLSEKAVNIQLIKMINVNMANKKLIKFVKSIPKKAKHVVFEFEDIKPPISKNDIPEWLKVISEEDCNHRGKLVRK